MKIGILTQALHGNYGGILQNFALQQVLKQMGHSCLTIDRHRAQTESPVKALAKIVMRNLKPVFESSLLTVREKRDLNSRQMEFIGQYIDRIGPITTQSEFDEVVADSSFDAFIVGSDQCWRPCYSTNISNYYLDFAGERDVRKIAYAASFGVDTWEYTPSQTSRVKIAAEKMDAVSVREETGKQLCKKHLGVDAEWVLDPTMLLGVDGFRPFVAVKDPSEHFITEYLLENSEEADAIVEAARRLCGTQNCRHNNRSKFIKRFKSVSGYKNIGIEEWLSNIANAEFLITDSFHGAVFAILFNVPFVVKLNGTRGNTRIESLLKDFGLEQCMCNSSRDLKMPSVDWDTVNAHLVKRRLESRNFLENALN